MDAKLNITFQGQNGALPDPMSYDATDADVRQIGTEAVRAGSVPGIPAFLEADFTDFVVDRFPATGDLPNRLMLRAKVPFGA